MALKFYTMTHRDLVWEMTVMIDEDFVYQSGVGPCTTRQAIKEMVEFWEGWENLLDTNNGDYTKTFLQLLANRALIEMIAENLNRYGVQEAFHDLEGWTRMDGSMGILITFTEKYPLHEDFFEVEEIHPPERELSKWSLDMKFPEDENF